MTQQKGMPQIKEAKASLKLQRFAKQFDYRKLEARYAALDWVGLGKEPYKISFFSKKPVLYKYDTKDGVQPSANALWFLFWEPVPKGLKLKPWTIYKLGEDSEEAPRPKLDLRSYIQGYIQQVWEDGIYNLSQSAYEPSEPGAGIAFQPNLEDLFHSSLLDCIEELCKEPKLREILDEQD